MTAARGTSTNPQQLVTAQCEGDPVAALVQRAEHLRRTSSTMHAFVAQAYRRRASELELEAFLMTMQVGAADAAA